MKVISVNTLSGTKSHLSEDGIKTLCGQQVTSGTDSDNKCKRCVSIHSRKVAAILEALDEANTDSAPILAADHNHDCPVFTEGLENHHCTCSGESEEIEDDFTMEPLSENILYMCQHAPTLNARKTWCRIAERKYDVPLWISQLAYSEK